MVTVAGNTYAVFKCANFLLNIICNCSEAKEKKGKKILISDL